MCSIINTSRELVEEVYEDSNISLNEHCTYRKDIIDNNLYFTFKGTDSLDNIEHDIECFQKEISSYFIEIFDRVLNDIRNLLKITKVDSIILTGHSLGGTVAQFMYKILSVLNLKTELKLITFNGFNDRSEDKLYDIDFIRNSIVNIIAEDKNNIDIEYITRIILTKVLHNGLEFTDNKINQLMKSKTKIDIINEGFYGNSIDLIRNSIRTDLSLWCGRQSSKDINPSKEIFGVNFNIGKSFRVELGLKNINDSKYRNFEYSEMEKQSNNTIISLNLCYKLESFLISIILLNKFKNMYSIDKDFINCDNIYILSISGDIVGNFRKSTLKDNIVYGNNIIPRLTLYHSLSNFDKYI